MGNLTGSTATIMPVVCGSDSRHGRYRRTRDSPCRTSPRMLRGQECNQSIGMPSSAWLAHHHGPPGSSTVRVQFLRSVVAEDGYSRRRGPIAHPDPLLPDAGLFQRGLGRPCPRHDICTLFHNPTCIVARCVCTAIHLGKGDRSCSLSISRLRRRSFPGLPE